jgi:hypothetical protein
MGAGIFHTQGFGRLGHPQIGVDRGHAGVSLDIIEPDAGHFDRRLGVAEIEPDPRRAHGAEGPGGDHVDFGRGLLRSQVPDDLGHFVGRNHAHGMVFNFFVDFVNIFGHDKPPLKLDLLFVKGGVSRSGAFK